MVAYAIACGITTAAAVAPPMRSRRSHFDRYSRSQVEAGVAVNDPIKPSDVSSSPCPVIRRRGHGSDDFHPSRARPPESGDGWLGPS